MHEFDSSNWESSLNVRLFCVREYDLFLRTRYQATRSTRWLMEVIHFTKTPMHIYICKCSHRHYGHIYKPDLPVCVMSLAKFHHYIASVPSTSGSPLQFYDN